MTDNKREKGSSIIRVLEILEAVSNCEQPMSPTDLGHLLDIPKPTAHRLVNTLQEEGWLYTNMRGNLVPGDRFHNVALGVLYSSRYKALRRAILERLSNEIGETCGIAIPDGTEMIYYDRIEANWPLRVHLPIGSRTPVWCTASGKLYLSTLPDARRRAILKNLPLEQLSKNTVTEPNALEEQLLSIKQTQIGIDNEEFVDGMSAIAVPIKNSNGKLFACLFCHAPVTRKSAAHLMDHIGEMRKAADELSDLIQSNEKNRTDH